MPSPPPTPSKEVTADRSTWRFHNISNDTEWLERYRPGGYHPVHLGDVFKGSRYKVIRKLGYGSFSTVWLARDQEAEDGKEIAIIDALFESTLPHPGKQQIIKLLDSFIHDGPNGSHQCSVFEAMGPSVGSILERLPPELGGGPPWKPPGPPPPTAKCPLWVAKSILRQTLLALDLLYQSGIAHGDLQPGNLLFSIKDLSSVGEEQLSQKQVKFAISDPVRRLDGKPDRWAPRYLALSQSLKQYADLSPEFVVKLSDFGEAFYLSDPPENPHAAAALRSPELIVGRKISSHQDVWSFGCLFFEFFTGMPLFDLYVFSDRETAIDEHFLQLYQVLGPLPEDLRSQWPNRAIYYDDQDELIKGYVGDLPADYDLSEVHVQPPLEKLFDKYCPENLSKEESTTIKNLLRHILQYEENKRPSTSDLLTHPWFASAS